jgi:hypothetical protein
LSGYATNVLRSARSWTGAAVETIQDDDGQLQELPIIIARMLAIDEASEFSQQIVAAPLFDQLARS